MRNDLNFEIFRRAFSARIKASAAIEASLLPSSQAVENLKEASGKLETAVAEIGDGDVEDQYRAFSVAVTIFAPLAEWKRAIRSADPDTRRFLSSAKMKASEVDRASSIAAVKQLGAFLDSVGQVEHVGDLDDIQEVLKSWPLPLLLFASRSTSKYSGFRFPLKSGGASGELPQKIDTTVAFLRFDIDGQPAKQWNYLSPGTAHDLTVELRVSNWPQGASTLTLTPVTIDSRERDWLPMFSFSKPDGNGPYTFTATGRAVLEVAHSFGSRPYEFLYAAEFDDTSACREVAIVGHRKLLLEGSDTVSDPLTGFSNVDHHLLTIRDRLRSIPGLNQKDVASTMVVLGSLGSIAAHALREGTFPVHTSERDFQTEATKLLRMRPEIGEHLHSHPVAAGGITDLTFREIPIELKVENNKVLYPKDFSNYFDQTASYAIGLGKRIGVLSVLEASQKTEPVGSVEEDIEFFSHQTGQSFIVIAVVIVRGGFPKPSSYSR